MGVGELLRRFIWNNLVVEMQHLKNREIHKAVDDLQLPFSNFQFETDDTNMLMDEMRKLGNPDFKTSFEMPLLRTSVDDNYMVKQL